LDVVMSRLVVPITGQTLKYTGDVCLRIYLVLLLKDNAGGWARQRFRVDSATDLTTFPAYEARRLNLPIPIQASVGVRHSQTGLEIRSGVLRFRIEGMDPTEYIVPCFFLGDPNVAPTAPPASLARNLLQPLALLDLLRFSFDKNATLTAPYGEMVIEKK
jgi:hypothetical protein